MTPERAVAATAAEPPAAPRAQRHPTSFAQRRMWFLHALEPASPLYNVPCAIRRQAPLDPAVLQRALDEVVRRHESLRTTFALEGGEPVQVVAPARRQHLAVVDLQKLPEVQRALEAQRLAFQEARAPFDLERGPLLRATALRLGEADHVLLFTFHHIVADGGSLQQFFRELAALEEAFAQGQASPLEPLAAQYADYARWQRERLQGASLEKHLSFWRRQLAGAPALVELPLDRPRPKVQRFQGATLPVVLDQEIADGLKALGRQTQSTMFMVLLAGFSALLHRYTGQTDVVLGTPIALRQRPEYEPLIGLFVNMLALRVDLSDRPGAADLVRRVRDLTIDAYSHQELPFERLVEELQPERSQAHQPLVQAVLVLQTAMAPGVAGDAPAPAPEAPAPVPSVAKFDLTLSLGEHAGQLVGGIEFNTDLFDAGTIVHLVERLKHLLRGMAQAPDRSISAVPLLDSGERGRMLADLNRTDRAWPEEGTVVDHIWRQVERTPDAVAVVADGGESLTYRELAARASAVAARLAALGQVRGRLVPACFQRSTDMLAGLLGILRAGAAYVPLDPDHPAPRIEFMVRDVGAAVAVSSPELAARLPSWLQVVQVDRACVPAGGHQLPLPGPDELAYAIFTSGSTGKPKCAANDHGALLNRLLWMQEAFALRPGDRVLQKTPYTFDVSVWELFWPLMAGATVVFARPGEHGDPAYLVDAIARHAISVTHFVPSMLRAFLEHPQVRQCASLRRVITSGEALPPDLVPLLHGRLGAELHNLYGPTECAIDVTHWHCARGLPPQVVPIGYPISNVRVYILDPATLEPVPPGAKGELFIAGRGVGRGYVNRPDLTAASFLPDVLSGDPGARMYRSGDLARYRADWSVEYLGRADQQVKLRGFRIEAGEVEEALRHAPGVADAVVTVRAGAGSEQQLVAHCVPDPDAGRAVRSLLRADGQGLMRDRLVEEMPNGLLVVARNRSETDFVFREIFTDQAYLRGGVDVRPGDVVLDVGANIGLFALFVGMTCPRARVFSFEPIPETFELLSLNAGLHAWDVSPRQVALGSAGGTARFTHYPNVSILSGRYADPEEEHRTVLAYERNRGHSGPEVEELVRNRLESRTFECPVKTLSQVMSEEGLERIDLLKIDAEKSEQDVLAGISEGDWPKIQQVVAEVHEIGPRLAQVCELLHRQGFEVAVEQEKALDGGGVSMVFARRASRGPAPEVEGRPAPLLPLSPARLRDQVRAAVARSLPEYMVPSRVIWVEALPRTSSGKIDRKSLPAEPAWLGASAAGPRSEPPATPLEVRIAQIWSEALGRGAAFGRKDSFFALGGHSLLATSVIARIRDVFRVEISVRAFFANPTVAGLAESIESGDAKPSELLDAIPRVERGPDDPAPLSFSQQRLWFLDRFSPGEVAYNIPAVIPVPGPVDAGILERSLSEIVRRHEILRTSFPFVNERPVQRVSSDWNVRMRRVDVSAMDPARIEDEVHALSVREVQRPFDLSAGPLFRALLIRCAPDRHYLVLTIHHTAADGWSMGVLFRELSTLYEAFSRGQPSPLPELPLQFADFAAWQRRWMTGEVLERQLGFWRGQLAGGPKLLALPADRARPPVQSTRGDLHTFEIDPEVYAGLAALAQRENCTPFMAMLAAFDVLLHRLSGARDLCVGAPIANRRRPELEGLIGFFVNTIVLRTRWDGDPSFRGLLASVRDVTLGAFAHQDMPFEHLVAELEPERAMDRSPIFQVMLILQNIQGWDSTGLVGARPVVTGAAKFDLSLYLLPAQSGLVGMLEYRTDLFTRETAACWMRQFCQVLAQVVTSPDLPISRLPLLGGDQPRVAAEAGPRTPELDDLVARVDAAAARSPEAPAVLRGPTTTTYGELVARSNALAARLQALGLRRGDGVAVAIAPSAELAAALLAVRRVGGAYLVLDPEDPPRRRAALIGSRARLLLVSGAPLEAGIPALDVLGGADPAGLPPGAPASPERAALVPEWTPEGPAAGELDARALAWRLEHSPVRDFAGRRIACATAPSQDAAVTLLAGLYHGASLLLPARDPAVAPRTLSRAMASASAQALVVAPDTLRILAREFGRSLEGVEIAVDLADPAQLAPLRAALPPPIAARCRWRLGIAGFGSVRLRPEADSVLLEVEAGSQLHTVTAELDPVPLGAFGELALGGPGVASAPLRTGVRAIRTASGEVRLRSGGELFRRAFADVELALSRAAGGTQAVVAHDGGAGEPVAFAVRAPGLSEAAIRQELEAWLPPSRHPRAVRLTGELPRGPDGGVDLRALLARAQDGAAPYAPPRTELEHGIARVWMEALGVERVGLNDDFFSLGGHSLLATHVVARVNVAFGVEIPLRTLFENPTVATLARAVDQLAKAEPGAQVPRLERSADAGPAPLSFAQQRLWFLDRYEPGSAFYNVVGAHPLQGKIDGVALERALNALVERHEALRLRFTVVDFEPVQQAEPSVHVPVPVIDLRALEPAARRSEAERLRDRIAREPFDLERGPLLRAQLVRMDDEAHVLLLSLHHIVADGWSMGTLGRELGILYAAFASGQTITLPELPIQYTDYARWQRAWLSGEVLARQLSVWRRMLAGAPPLLQLPADRPRPPAQVFQGGLYAGALDPELVAPLRALSRGERATTFMTLFAAYAELLGRYTGREDVVVGIPIANRRRPELAGLVGLVANTLVIRVDLGGAPTFRDLLGRVRAATLESYEHQDTPFEKLVEELQPDRDASFNPLFQVMFTHQTTSEQPEGGGPGEQPEMGQTGAAKFDFTMFLMERAHEISVGVEYNTHLFTAETVARFAEHYGRLLARAVRDPDRPLVELGLFEPSDLRDAPVMPAGRPEDVLQALAEVRPDQVAVVAPGGQVTWGQLLERSDRWVAALRSQEVEPGTPVAVALADPLEELAAWLGVLRAGGAVVPLERCASLGRIRARMAEAGASTVVAEPRAAGALAEVGRVVTAGDAAAGAAAGGPSPGPEQAALIAEGGARVSRGALAASVRAEIQDAKLQPGERTLLAVLRPALALHDALAVWLSGGAVVPADADAQEDPAALCRLAAATTAARAHVSPPLLRQLAQPGSAEELPATLRELVVEHPAGLPGEALQGLRNRMGGGAVLERLVPASGLPALQRWTSTTERPRSRPRPAIPVRVLDARRQPLAPGMPGVLHVLGLEPVPAGVTGRWREGGAVQLLGRTGARLQARGYEVDRDQVEAALRAVPGVRDVGVAVRDQELVAFVQGSYSEAQARLVLGEQLPAFMVPGSLVQVARLPRTASGEVDHARLPAILAPARELAVGRTRLERTVAEAFADAFGRAGIGLDEELLALGGRHREARDIAARLSEELGAAVDPAAVLLHGTVERLTVALTQRNLADAMDAEQLLAELESLDERDVDALLREERRPQ